MRNSSSLVAAFLTLQLLATPVQAAPGVESLIQQMTLAEKIGQLQSGAPAIPRLGVPAYDWWSEGLHGIARNGYATVFPQAIGLAATFDPELMRQIGDVVSTEARAKFNASGGVNADHTRYGGLTIWSPNINIDRDPRWGRGQETYGEDPYLTGTLASAFVEGVQGPDPAHPKAIATPKHLAVHSGPESSRHGFDVDVSPYDLEVTYTPAFRMALTQGAAQSVMCAYNALHGVPVCASPALLTDRLRRAWGFQGFVVTDCDAVDDMTHFHFFRPDNAGSSAAALMAGTDLDCGTAFGDLDTAVVRGEASERAIDAAVGRLFAARQRLGMLGGVDLYAKIGPDQIGSASARALAQKAARESIVLLKNANNRLPLKPGVRMAVIGPNADALETLEANYNGVAKDPVTPLQGLRRQPGVAAAIYAQGSTVAEGAPVDLPETALRTGAGPEARVGLKGEYFDGLTFAGPPKLVRTDRVVAFDWDRTAPAPGVDPAAYAVRWTGVLTPPGPGDYALGAKVARCFDCRGHDAVRLFIDDKLVFEDDGSDRNVQASLHFDDAAPHRLRLELVHGGEDQGVRLQWIAPAAAQLAEAVAAAKAADVVVAFVGLSPDVEGEELRVLTPGFDGGDRTAIELPAPQRRLLQALGETGKPLIVVAMAGGAVSALDQDQADAVLAAGYPGQAGGQAIAETLMGASNPSGRMPVTVYRSTKDLPAFGDYRMVGRTYRYFKGEALYPFGFGLSYTRFVYGKLAGATLTLTAGQDLEVSAVVRNTGDRAGDEVAQLYLIPPQGPYAPLHSLIGFQRLHLAPSEGRRIVFKVSPRDLSGVDGSGSRAVLPGGYSLFVGGGQPGDADGVSIPLQISGEAPLPP